MKRTPRLALFHTPEQGGFTLLEVMVAVAILGMALVVIMQLFGTGLKAATLEKKYALAVVLAKAKMGELLVDSQISEGSDSGSLGNGFEWESEVTEYERPEPEGVERDSELITQRNTSQKYKLYKVTLTVNDSDTRKKYIVLNSLRLVKVVEEVSTQP